MILNLLKAIEEKRSKNGSSKKSKFMAYSQDASKKIFGKMLAALNLRKLFGITLREPQVNKQHQPGFPLLTIFIKKK